MFRHINSQVEEEKVGVCKQLMDFFTDCGVVELQEEEEELLRRSQRSDELL